MFLKEKNKKGFGWGEEGAVGTLLGLERWGETQIVKETQSASISRGKEKRAKLKVCVWAEGLWENGKRWGVGNEYGCR